MKQGLHCFKMERVSEELEKSHQMQARQNGTWHTSARSTKSVCATCWGSVGCV